MMHEKAIWKHGIRAWNPKLPGVLPLNPLSGFTSPPYEPKAARGQHAAARWVMAYSHKTQSFMKNKGQQKYLDKALMMYGSWDLRHDSFLSFWEIFWPLILLITRKIKILKKWKKVWKYYHFTHVYH